MQWFRNARKLRALLMFTGLVLVGGLLILALLVLLLRQVPGWYEQTAQPAGPERQLRAGECLEKCVYIYSVSEDKEWGDELTDQELNAFFEEGFRKSLVGRDMPHTLDQPRVTFEDDLIRLGFRYGHKGLGSAVVSLDLRVWVSGQEPNCIMVELKAFHIGALPFAVQTVLETLTDVARERKIDVSWYRNPETGRPVAVLRFQSDKTRPTIAFRTLDHYRRRKDRPLRESGLNRPQRLPRRATPLPCPPGSIRRRSSDPAAERGHLRARSPARCIPRHPNGLRRHGRRSRDLRNQGRAADAVRTPPPRRARPVVAEPVAASSPGPRSAR